MLVLRFIGALFLLLAVIALAADLSGPVPHASGARGAGARDVIIYHDAREKTAFTSLYQLWQMLAPVSLQAVRKSVETKVHPMLWNPIIRSVLEVPAFISLGLLAFGFLHLGRPRRRVEIFEN